MRWACQRLALFCCFDVALVVVVFSMPGYAPGSARPFFCGKERTQRNQPGLSRPAARGALRCSRQMAAGQLASLALAQTRPALFPFVAPLLGAPDGRERQQQQQQRPWRCPICPQPDGLRMQAVFVMAAGRALIAPARTPLQDARGYRSRPRPPACWHRRLRPWRRGGSSVGQASRPAARLRQC